MKARISKPAPAVIIAYKQDKYLNTLRKTASSLGVSFTEAAYDKAGETVGYLAGYSGFASNGSSEEAGDGCLIFAGLDSRQMNRALDTLRGAGVNIPYKAVLTDSNKSWTLKKLISELAEERSRLGG